MNKTKRITINLLGAGLLLGATAARAEEKAPAAAADAKQAAAAAHIERLLALPWTELRESPFRLGKAPNDKEFVERYNRAYEEITKRQGEVYKQIDEGKVDEAYPTVFDVYVLEQWLTEYARAGRCRDYFDARAKVLLDPAGKERLAAQRLRLDNALNRWKEEARQEYEAALKAGIEANPEWAAAERRLKEATAKLEVLKVNDRGAPKDGARKLTDEETAAAAAAVKEYKDAEGAARRFNDAFHKNPENRRLKTAADYRDAGGDPYKWMTGGMNPGPNWSGGYERTVSKVKLGWHGTDWQVPGSAPDPALPQVDESGRKAGTAKALDLGPSTSSGQGGVKLELVWIPACEFMMGSPTNEPGRYMFERLHRVKLTKGFWMGKYEVTQEQWQRVMGNNPNWFTNAGPKAPVECVRLDQVQKFIRKLGEMTAGKDGGAGGKLRLPTEAEWEWACRAGTATALYNGKMTIKGGNNSPELGAIAWYAGNSGVDYEGGLLSTLWEDKEMVHHSAGTHPVGQKKPNAWGLYDMLGNVGEWCEDCDHAYPSQAVTDPTGPKEGDQHVVRGGFWQSIARFCRSAARNASTHEYCHRNSMIGFRVVLEDPAAVEKAK